VKHLSSPLPEYRLDVELDYNALGRAVDARIAAELADGHYVARASSSDDHEAMSRSELLAVIRETGTDKYDPSRLEVAHDAFAGYDHDFHGGRFTVEADGLIPTDSLVQSTMFGDFAFHFREHAPLNRGHPVGIDLLLVYAASHLEPASYVDSTAPRQRDSLTRNLFKFLDPGRKADALCCIVSQQPE
jgi:hypothetical protein